jgi:hypothetical protein
MPTYAHATGRRTTATGRSLGEFLHRSFAPRAFAVAIAATLAIACFRVASVPTNATPQDRSISDVFAQIQVTVAGLRREAVEQRATYTRMGNDTRALQERLSSTGSN